MGTEHKFLKEFFLRPQFLLRPRILYRSTGNDLRLSKLFDPTNVVATIGAEAVMRITEFAAIPPPNNSVVSLETNSPAFNVNAAVDWTVPLGFTA